MPVPAWVERLPDGSLANALKRVPAEPLPPLPREPSLIDRIVDDFRDGTGHDTELDQHLA